MVLIAWQHHHIYTAAHGKWGDRFDQIWCFELDEPASAPPTYHFRIIPQFLLAGDTR